MQHRLVSVVYSYKSPVVLSIIRAFVTRLGAMSIHADLIKFCEVGVVKNSQRKPAVSVSDRLLELLTLQRLQIHCIAISIFVYGAIWVSALSATRMAGCKKSILIILKVMSSFQSSCLNQCREFVCFWISSRVCLNLMGFSPTSAPMKHLDSMAFDILIFNSFYNANWSHYSLIELTLILFRNSVLFIVW